MNGITIQSTDIDADAVPVSQRIVTTVADELDADPIELEPLYETIDPDALDQLFHSDAGGGVDHRSRLTFEYEGCEVTVYGNDQIDVTKRTGTQSDQTSTATDEIQPTIRSD